MSPLFAQIYLDEDVSVLVASLLAARGFKAITTRDAGGLGKSDAAQLEYAANHDMLFLTHNRADFEALHRKYLAAVRLAFTISSFYSHYCLTDLLF